MSLPFWDPRKLLELPAVYDFFQEAVGANRGRRLFFERHVAPLAPARILEVGCGPGTNCRWLPDGLDYVGCDLSPEYIDFARRQYGDRATFHAASVGEMAALGLAPFDAVIAVAVLHHLSDQQVLTMCDEAAELLKPGGVLITADPCFTREQSRLSTFVTSLDRGRFVRFPEQYQALLGRRFPAVRAEVSAGRLLVIDQPGLLMVATKP